LHKPSIGILGPGAIGGFIASVFYNNKFPVNCIARKENLKQLKAEGISIESSTFGSFTANPKFSSKYDINCDILFIAVKTPFLEDALNVINIESVKNTIIISLQNGIEHINTIRKKAGNCLVVGMITGEFIRKGTTSIKHTSPHVCIQLASKDIANTKLLGVVNLLQGIGIEASCLLREEDVVWNKLVKLNALASLTAASQLPIGVIRTSTKWRLKLEGIVKEGVRIAQAEGVDINEEIILKQIDNLPAGLSTSLQRDISSGQVSELDFILGAVIRKGKQYGIPCPTTEDFYIKITNLILASKKTIKWEKKI